MCAVPQGRSLGAAAAQAQSNAQSAVQRTYPVDGRLLIAELNACEQYVEQARRDVCERNVRKGQPSALRLKLDGDTGDDSSPFHRFDR